MKFFIDADSFPVPARATIIRAAERHGLKALFVAQKDPGLPTGPCIRFVAVPPGDDGADNWIVDQSMPGDLVFTRDIPLAARLVEKKILVLNDRGTVYTAENVRSRLSERDFMTEMRFNNMATPSIKSYGQRELAEFANAFDRELTRLLRVASRPEQ